MGQSNRHALPGIDFVRTICAYTIVCFHFATHSVSPARDVFFHENYGVGYSAVGIFFIISGMVLRWNYPTVPNIKEFYYKRGKSLFPMFWIAYFLLFFLRLLRNGLSILFLPISRLFLSIIGMDGYFLYMIPNYYQLGEWFLGAIILLYLMYPIVNRFFSMNCYLTYFVSMGLFFFVIYSDFFQIVKSWNLLYCLGYFTTGMLLIQHKQWIDNEIILALAVLSLAVLLFVPIPLTFLTICYFQTVCTFIILYRIGCCVTKYAIWEKVFSFGGKLSYPLFLVHHVIIVRLFRIRNPENTAYFWCMLAISLLLCTLGAWALLLLTKNLTLLCKRVRRISERRKNVKA